MQIEKIVKPTVKEDLKIIEGTLLSIDETEQLPKRLLKYNDWWWLRSIGCSRYYAAYVSKNGSVYYSGDIIYHANGYIRPALVIENLNSSSLQIGDCFIFGGKEFEIISEDIAFCKSDIGSHCFREDWKVKDANDYEKSDVKKFVDEWFEASKEEMGD